MATDRGDLELQSIRKTSVENLQSSTKAARTLKGQPSKEEETDNLSFYLRIIKWISLVFIALIVCSGAVLSKVSLVSITGRMFDLTR